MAQNRAAGLGNIIRSLSLAKSPAQLTLGFVAFTVFFLMNQWFFPDYNILREFGDGLNDMRDDLAGGVNLYNATTDLFKAFGAFAVPDRETSGWMVVLFYGTVWIVLSFLFGTISRITAVRAGLGRKTALRAAVAYVLREGRWWAYFLPPLYFAGAFLALVLAISVLGVVGQASTLFAAIVYPLVFVLALAAVLVALTGILGLPFLSAAVSVDGAGSFDAVSRTCMYIFPRIPKYLLFIATALAVGVLAFLVISSIVAAAVDLSFEMLDFWWDVFDVDDIDLKFGAIYNKIRDEYGLQTLLERKESADFADGNLGITLIGLVVWTIVSLVPAYAISYGLSSGTLTYMVFRRDEDGTPFDEIYTEEEAYEEELLDEVIDAHHADRDPADFQQATIDRRGRRAGPKKGGPE